MTASVVPRPELERAPLRPGGDLGNVAARAVPVAVVGLTAGAVVLAATAGAPPLVLLVLAAAPLALVFGYRYSLAAVPAALVVRALIDDSGSVLLTGGIAAGLLGLAALVVWRAPGWTVPTLVIGVALVASAWAGAPTHGGATTYGEALRLLSALAIALVVVNAPGTVTMHRVAYAVQAIGVVPAAYAVLQLVTGTGTNIDGVIRSSGTLAQANSAAVLFALGNVATFALLLDRAPRRWLHLGLMGLFLVAQASTGSIGGAVAALVMIVVQLFAVAGRRIDRVALGAAGLSLTVYAALNSSIGAERLAQFTTTDATGEDNSLTWRLNAWDKVLEAWREHPFLGNGVGATLAETILRGNIPHNEYVRLLAEIGVVGLLVVTVLIAAYVVRMVRLGRAGADPATVSLALAVLAGSMVNALAANTMLYSVSFYTTVLVLAGCWRAAQRSAPRQPPPGPPGSAG